MPSVEKSPVIQRFLLIGGVCFIEVWNVDMFPKWGRGYAKWFNHGVMRICFVMRKCIEQFCKSMEKLLAHWRMYVPTAFLGCFSLNRALLNLH